jgi:peptide/nickel transport system substrate-binding protein
MQLQPGVSFHDGTPANAEAVRNILQAQLPRDLGPAFDDINQIRAVSGNDLEFSLRRPSTFLLERLDTQIQRPGLGGIGTGPFFIANSETNSIELRANDHYFGGKPSIDRITIRPYTSVRAAWADLLRGQVDMLYDVGVDSLDSLESSNDVRIFTFLRGYAYMLLLNVRKPYLADPDVRRALNAAIDRDELVRTVLRGHGVAAVGPVWPQHWAYRPDLPKLEYNPRSLASRLGQRRLRCIMFEPAHERIALAVQRQLQAIGVNLDVELLTDDKMVAQRLAAGDFDAFLSDFPQGPPLVRPYLFWYSGAPFNYGKFSSAEVDAALDTIRHARDDATYRNGVAAFQRAVVADPPAIFLAWRERARVVSRRFQVPVERGTDILPVLHLWRPATEEKTARVD